VGIVVASYGQECSTSVAIPQLQTFSFGVGCSGYAKGLLEARRSDNLPVLDFTKLRTLVIDVEKYSDLVVAHAFMKVTENLEILSYGGTLQISLRVYTETECHILSHLC
jgi:hypothetical protein